MKKEGNICIGTGLGVGALGAAGAAVLGAVCPVCIVATPLLIGAGVVQHIRARRSEAPADEGVGKKTEDGS